MLLETNALKCVFARILFAWNDVNEKSLVSKLQKKAPVRIWSRIIDFGKLFSRQIWRFAEVFVLSFCDLGEKKSLESAFEDGTKSFKVPNSCLTNFVSCLSPKRYVNTCGGYYWPSKRHERELFIFFSQKKLIDRTIELICFKIHHFWKRKKSCKIQNASSPC